MNAHLYHPPTHALLGFSGRPLKILLAAESESVTDLKYNYRILLYNMS